MKSLSLILRIIAIIAAISASVLFFIAQGKLEEKEAALTRSVEAQNDMQIELSAANDEILQLNKNLLQSRADLASSKATLDSIRSEMFTAKQEVTRNQTQIKQAQNEINNLQIDLKNARGKLIQAEREMATIDQSGELTALTNRVEELEGEKLDLELALKSAESKNIKPKNNLNRTTVASKSTSKNSSGILGEELIIATASPKSGIIILNAAPGVNLSIGDQLNLVNDYESIANVQLTKITSDYIIANIMPGANNKELNPGTVVRILR
tara:strand:+ start:266 stop:1069 length:804 start_codon:yes stop_codon:yes gene_type:complete